MGTAPGDPYKTPEDAAKDWATENYSKTAYSNFEVVSLIYSTVDEKGNTYYSYTMPIYGDEPHKTTPNDAKPLLPTGATVSGVVHSHTGNKTRETRDKDKAEGYSGIGEFSRADANYIKNNGGTAFVVYPNLADDKLVNISRLDYTSSNGKYTATGVSYRQSVNPITYYDKRYIDMRLSDKLNEHIQKGTCPSCMISRK